MSVTAGRRSHSGQKVAQGILRISQGGFRLATVARLASGALLALLTAATTTEVASAAGEPPPGADARAITIDDLLSLRMIGGRLNGLLLSPDRTHVAVQVHQMDLSTNQYTIDWVVIPSSGGAAVRVGDGGEAITDVDDEGTDNGNLATPVAKWSPDGQWIAYLRRSNGQTQIWRSRRDGERVEPVTTADADVDTFTWSSDQTRILFQTKRPRAELLAAVQHDQDFGFLYDDGFSPAYALQPRYANKREDAVRVLDLATGVERSARAEEENKYRAASARVSIGRPNARNTAFAESGRWAALEPLDPQQQGERPPLTVVVEGKLRGGAPLICRLPECTGQIRSLWWAQGGDRVYFLRRQGHALGERAIYEWRPGSARAQLLLRTEDWLADDCVSVQEEVLCLHEAPTQPRRIVAIRRGTSSMRAVYDPNPHFDQVSFTPVEKYSWHDTYGNETFGHLVYPAAYKAGERFPLVIVQYRSAGFLNGGVGDEYPIHVLAASGFFVLSWDRPEFRTYAASHSSLETYRYAHAEHREHVSKQSALEAIIDRLAQDGLIDPMRVGITGLSDGAETTFHGLIHSKRYAVAAVSTPPGDPVAFYLQSRRDRAFRQQLGVPTNEASDAARDFWAYKSLALNVGRVTTPILMNLSTAELLYAVQSISTLQDAGKAIEVHVYPGEYHIKHKPRHLRRILDLNVDWLNFWLRDAVDDQPTKSAQYTRWRRMREAPDNKPTSVPTRGVND